MSAKTSRVLRRRLGRVRGGLQDAYLEFDWKQWKALTRRERVLSGLLRGMASERRAA